MALGTIGLNDLSIVTDALIDLLEAARDNSPIWGGPPPFALEITGAAPDTTRTGGEGCVLSVYLLHVIPNANLRNLALRTPFQPLALDLYYLVTAWAANRYVEEQQAMSVALKCFHENPIVRKTVTLEPGNNVPQEFSVTMEIRSVDDLGQLWQGIDVASRLAIVYRVSVAFLAPPAAPPPGPPPRTVNITVGRTDVPLLLGSRSTESFRTPAATQTLELSPAVAAPADSFTVLGVALDTVLASRVFFVDGNNEEDVTVRWNAAHAPAAIVVTLPQNGTPPPGIYQLRVGQDAFRSNVTPFSIAALVAPPADNVEPLLAPDNDVFTLGGIGFVAGATDLAVGGVTLNETADAASPGEFRVDAGTSIQFRLPAGLPNGTHEVRVRVNGVQSTPAWWVKVPQP